MSETTARPPVRTRRWLGAGLVASLAVNLLLLGAAGAAFVRHRAGEAAALGGFSANLLGYAQSLPASRRHELLRAGQEELRGMRALRSDVRAARQQWHDALVAEPFDRERFARAQSNLLEAENKVRTKAQQLFLALAAELSREERAAFVEWYGREAAARRSARRWSDGGPADVTPALRNGAPSR